MCSHRAHDVVAACFSEALESRLLLSAALPAASAAELLSEAEDTTLAVLVPAVMEQESDGGMSNDLAADAQPLQFQPVLGEDAPGPLQSVVTGIADGLGGGGESYDEQIRIYGYISAPNVYSTEMTGAFAPGGDGVFTVAAKADLAGTEKFLTLTVDGVVLGDLFVDDGESFIKVSAQVTIPQEQLAAMAADGVLEVTLTPSAAVARVLSGYVIPELSYEGVGGEGTADYYTLDLDAGESVSLSADGDGPVNLELLDADGTVLAAGDVASFVADRAGAYYVRITGEGDYCLVANRDAMMDVEDNGAAALAQQVVGPKVNGHQWVVGSLTGPAGEPDSDFYTADVPPKGKLQLRMSLPDVQANVAINVYDAAGELVAQGTQLPNGVVTLQHKAPKSAADRYFIQVTADIDAQINYVLSVRC